MHGSFLSFLQGVIGLDGELGRTLGLLSSFAYVLDNIWHSKPLPFCFSTHLLLLFDH